jgi:hypothetical protein
VAPVTPIAYLAGLRPGSGADLIQWCIPGTGRWPVAATKKAQIAAVRRSVTDLPMSTAGRHIGSVRKRSMMPPLRSLLSPTAVPMAEVVRLSASIPAIAKSA